MPRRSSENTVTISVKMPQAWVDFAAGLADLGNEDARDTTGASRSLIHRAAKLTRTDVMRMALELGLKELSGGLDPNQAVDWAAEVAEMRGARMEKQKKKKKLSLRRIVGRST
jgi:hypothetical protein